MNVDFWSDIVCPYCGLMAHRLRAATDRAAFGTQVTVRHHSFQVRPDLPRAGIGQRELFTALGRALGGLPLIAGCAVATGRPIAGDGRHAPLGSVLQSAMKTLL